MQLVPTVMQPAGNIACKTETSGAGLFILQYITIFSKQAAIDFDLFTRHRRFIRRSVPSPKAAEGDILAKEESHGFTRGSSTIHSVSIKAGKAHGNFYLFSFHWSAPQRKFNYSSSIPSDLNATCFFPEGAGNKCFGKNEKLAIAVGITALPITTITKKEY